MKKRRRLQRSDAMWLAAVTLLVLLQFWWLPGEPWTPHDTYSNTIEGKRGFFQTLDRLSKSGLLPPVRRETQKLVPDERCTLLVLSPDRYPDTHEQEDLSKFVMNGGTLVFAPNWVEPECRIPQLNIKTDEKKFSAPSTVVAVPAAAPPGTSLPPLGEEGTDGSLPAELPESPDAQTTLPPVVPAEEKARPDDGMMKNPMPGNPIMPSPSTEGTPFNGDDEEIEMEVVELRTESQLVPGSVGWRSRASLSTYGLKPTVLVKTIDNEIQAASWQYGNGMVVVSASSDVFSNRAMLIAPQAELAVRLVEHAHSHHSRFATSATVNSTPIVVSEYLNASDSYRGTGVLMSPTLRSGTLQLITIALLAGWFGFHRFGPAKPNTSAERRSLTESAAAVGNLHFRTNSGSEAVRSYLEYMKTQIQKQFGHSVHLTDSATIAARCGMAADDIKRRIDEAVGLSTYHATSTAQAANAIRSLSEILNRLHGVRHGA